MLTIDAIEESIKRMFGGYNVQVRDAATVLFFGLHLNEAIGSASDDRSKQIFKYPRGVLIIGPAGTGKSKLAQLLTESSGRPFLRISTNILIHR